MKRTYGLVLALAAVVIITTGCGSSSGDKRTGGGADMAAVGSSEQQTTKSLGETSGLPASGGASQDGLSAAAPAVAARAGGATTPPVEQSNGQPSQAYQRKIIYNVFLDLTVKDVQSSFSRIAILATVNGGFVVDSNFRTEGNQQRAALTIRVPAESHQSVLEQIRGLALKLDSEKAGSNDVTEEFVDLQSRQRTLEATEAQLLLLLGQARSVPDILTVQERLNTVRSDIERVKGRLVMYGRLTELATIQIQLKPEPAPVAKPAAAPDNPLLAGLWRGWHASTAVVGALAVGIVTVAAFSWWLIPVALLLIWLVRRETRRRASAPRAGTAPAADASTG